MDKKNKKIYLGGCPFGGGNIGDDAILSSLVNNFGDIDHELTICTVPEKTSDYVHEYILRKNKNSSLYKNRFYSNPILGISLNSNRYPIQSIFNHRLNKAKIKNNDLLLCGGGTLITDMPWHMMKVISIAQRQGTPTVIFGVGMAEIKDKKSIKKLNKTLNQLEDIYVRDVFVKERLVNIGVAEQKIKICFDPAITLCPNNDLIPEKYLSPTAIRYYKNEQINVGITLSSEPDIREGTNFNAIKTVIKYLISTFDANIFLIPTNCNSNLDEEFMKPLVIDPKVFLIKKRFEPEDLIAFSQNFSLFLSSRLHMNIFSSMAGTPFVGLIRNSKISDYSHLHHLKPFYFSDLNSHEFTDYLNLLIENNIKLRNKILENIEKMRLIHFKCVSEIKDKYLS